MPEPQAPGPPFCWERQTWTHNALNCSRLDVPCLGEGLGLLPRGESVCRGPEDMVPERPRREEVLMRWRPAQARGMPNRGWNPFIHGSAHLSLPEHLLQVGPGCRPDRSQLSSPLQQATLSSPHNSGVYLLVSQSTWVCGG